MARRDLINDSICMVRIEGRQFAPVHRWRSTETATGTASGEVISSARSKRSAALRALEGLGHESIGSHLHFSLSIAPID